MSAGRGRRPDAGRSEPAATPLQAGLAVIAWLLRVNRIYGSDDNLAVASRFLRALGTASEPQISRWERAAARVSPAVIGRYEEVLDLPNGTISAVAHTLYRESLGRLGPPMMGAPGDEEHLRRLLHTALGGGVMTGDDWIQLTAGLWSVPILLYPDRLWHELAERLLAELLIAEGTAWLNRCEAINRLLGHRHATRAVIDACVAVVDDRRSQILIEPMALLELCPHPAATRQLLRQIEAPTGSHAARAAWWAVAEKVGRGHFTPHELATITQCAAETLQDNDSHLASRLAAAEAIRQLLPGAPDRLRRAIHELSKNDIAAGHVIRSGTTCGRATADTLAGNLASATLSAMPREVLHRDPTLERLISYALFHPQGSRRVIAAQAIAATPYRPALAAALARELGRNATLANPTLAATLIQAMIHMGTAREAPLLRRLAMDTGLPCPISESAAWAVGHLRRPDDGAFWHTVGQALPNVDRSRAKALIYSMGTAGRRLELDRLATARQTHAELRTAARWWLDLPELIRDSATT